jgi:hypothetical protein
LTKSSSFGEVSSLVVTVPWALFQGPIQRSPLLRSATCSSRSTVKVAGT